VADGYAKGYANMSKDSLYEQAFKWEKKHIIN